MTDATRFSGVHEATAAPPAPPNPDELVASCRNGLIHVLNRAGLQQNDSELIADTLSLTIATALRSSGDSSAASQGISSAVQRFVGELQNLGHAPLDRSGLWSKILGAITNFLHSLTGRSAQESTVDVAENITNQMAQDFSRAELSDHERHEIFASFKELWTDQILSGTLEPKARMGILLMASSISVDDTRQWLKDMPANLKTHLLEGGVAELITTTLFHPGASTDNIDHISPTVLEYAYEALNYGHVQAAHDEREIIPIDQWNGLTSEYGNFIQEASRGYCPRPGARCFRSEDNTYVGEIFQGSPLSQLNAAAFGINLETLPEEDRRNPDLKIVPLFVFSYGVGSGNTARQALASVRNMCNGVPENLRQAEKVIKGEIDKVTSAFRALQENGRADPNIRYVPVMGGHSMGGMFAHAVAAKNNWSSICWNTLGHGNGVIDDFVGRENWARANNTTHARQHISFTTEGDLVSDRCIRKPTLGQSYRIPNFIPKTATNVFNMHGFFQENFRAFCAQRFSRTGAINA
ncbi:MAG: hypothetical protein LBD40_03250 [Puniceicoccales bacterium]|jgi:hypothetical protein|nr:hypothetical protein [Puniceicoccales bacterium]